MDLPDYIIIFFIFILGAAFGSFLNVVIYRVPAKMSLIKPASHCGSCKTPVKPFDNIPILSYFILGGKCRHHHLRGYGSFDHPKRICTLWACGAGRWAPYGLAAH